MTTAQRLMTAEDLWNLPDHGGHRELVRGELREMAPAGSQHGAVIINLAAPLAQFVKANHLGIVFAAETGFIIARQPDTVRGPDIAFVAKERIPASGLPRNFFPARSISKWNWNPNSRVLNRNAWFLHAAVLANSALPVGGG
ncbi:MAG TPA: Uma2 family endonuclease, partial [Tepidisphaeraceae bacterium]|nr:Uma2 family endonuclease [Tepidisphaeraceae bacterium]